MFGFLQQYAEPILVQEGQNDLLFDSLSGCYVSQQTWDQLIVKSRSHRVSDYLTQLMCRDELETNCKYNMTQSLGTCSRDQARIRSLFNVEVRISKAILKALRTTFITSLKLEMMKAFPNIVKDLPVDGTVTTSDIQFMLSKIEFKYLQRGNIHTYLLLQTSTFTSSNFNHTKNRRYFGSLGTLGTHTTIFSCTSINSRRRDLQHTQ